jgi:ribose transport system substrate-binding protein
MITSCRSVPSASQRSVLRIVAASILSAFCACVLVVSGCGKEPAPASTSARSSPTNGSTDTGPSGSPAGSAAPDASPTNAASQTSVPGVSDTPIRIALIPKGTTHDFWKSVHAGAIKAQREFSSGGSGAVEVTFRGPEREDDREQQVALMQNMISGGYDAIVLAPLDDTALVAPVRQATAARIPVVVIDSGLSASAGTDFVTYIATDNTKGGRLAGEKMIELLGGANAKGRVLMLRYQEGSASTTQREQGFVDAIKTAPGIELIDPKRYAGATRASAQEAAENLLGAHANLAGIYCPNESSTFGMLLAARSRGLVLARDAKADASGADASIAFVGFDSSTGLVDALRAGEIDALVVQNPMKMGYLGVKAAVDHLRGITVEPSIDTGVELVTTDTIDRPDFKELLSPDLEKYLGGK